MYGTDCLNNTSPEVVQCQASTPKDPYTAAYSFCSGSRRDSYNYENTKDEADNVNVLHFNWNETAQASSHRPQLRAALCLRRSSSLSSSSRPSTIASSTTSSTSSILSSYCSSSCFPLALFCFFCWDCAGLDSVVFGRSVHQETKSEERRAKKRTKNEEVRRRRERTAWLVRATRRAYRVAWGRSCPCGA